MAGEFQFIHNFVELPVLTSAPATATGFSEFRAVNRRQPYRSWRSTTTAITQHLRFDAGSLQNHGCVGVITNASQILLQVGISAVDSGIPGHSAAEVYSPVIDSEDGWGKFFISYTPGSHRHFGVSAVGGAPTLDGANYFEIFTIFWGAAAPASLLMNPEPLSVTFEPNETINDEGGRAEVQVKGNSFLRMTFQQEYLTPAERVQWDSLKLLGQRTPVLWFRNRGVPQEMYWMHYEGSIAVEEKGGGIVSMQQVWRQLI